MSALDVDVIRCAACGNEIEPAEADRRIASQQREVDDVESLVRACARHLMLDCERRYTGHPAFGAETRWNRYVHPNGTTTLEIAWTGSEWGFPFRLYEVPGFQNGISGKTDWGLD